jgi:hypothetical protein
LKGPFYFREDDHALLVGILRDITTQFAETYEQILCDRVHTDIDQFTASVADQREQIASLERLGKEVKKYGA